MKIKVIALAILVLGPFISPGHAQTLLNITVTADKMKAKGSPWDGPPVSNARVPLTTGRAAPDLAICIVERGKPARCEMRRADSARPLSNCQNAFKCAFERISVPSGPFGLIILDLDVRRHDLVDFAIIVPDSHPSPTEVELIDIEMHKHIGKMAPTTAASEHRLRQKDGQVLILDQCGKACRLLQSEIRLERAK